MRKETRRETKNEFISNNKEGDKQGTKLKARIEKNKTKNSFLRSAMTTSSVVYIKIKPRGFTMHNEASEASSSFPCKYIAC